MTTGMVQDHNIEKQIGKQMGCMAGFIKIFDRHQILAGKRFYSAKRLPPSVASSTPQPENAVPSPEISAELDKTPQTRSTPSPDRVKHFSPMKELRSPVPERATSAESKPKPLPIFEFKEGTRSSWKFSREAPRLSLDSRAIVDGKGSIYPREIRTNASILSGNRSETSTEEGDEQRRSPSVIARLMGLEPLPNSEPEPVKKAELRRSASESRVSKEFYQNRFVDGNNFRLKQSQHLYSQDNIASSVLVKNAANADNGSDAKVLDRRDFAARRTKAEPARSSRALGPRKIFFDSADVFPEPKQTASIYGEIEKRLKMRGIDEPSKDLETLKQILEALQLKGLLHSRKPLNQRNFVYDRTSHSESPIVVMKVARSPTSANRFGMVNNESPPSSYRLRHAGRRNVNVTGEAMPIASSRRDRLEFDRNMRNQNRGRNSSSPTRCESNVKSPNRRGLLIETQRRVVDSVEQRRTSPVQSSRINPSKVASDSQITNRSPRNRKPGAAIHTKERKIFVSQAEDESSTFSESSISNSSQTDMERPNKVEEYKDGRSLLERCDKLLHSIAEITATELQPSPVSVLDSSFYQEESSPSPVLKRQVDFKDQVVDVEENAWVQAISSVESSLADQSDDCVYVMDILRASHSLRDNSDVFLLLEEQQYLKGKDISKDSRLQRRLIFDTINEILDRNRQLPPWNSNAQPESMGGPTSVQKIWFEFQRMRDREEASDDLFEVICNVLKKDLTRDASTGWRDWPVEISQAVLDIERLIFKDLIGETIRDLAASPGIYNLNNANMPRRKLVF